MTLKERNSSLLVALVAKAITSRHESKVRSAHAAKIVDMMDELGERVLGLIDKLEADAELRTKFTGLVTDAIAARGAAAPASAPAPEPEPEPDDEDNEDDD